MVRSNVLTTSACNAPFCSCARFRARNSRKTGGEYFLLPRRRPSSQHASGWRCFLFTSSTKIITKKSQGYKRKKRNIQLLAPLEVTPSWALVFYTLIPFLPFSYTEPNFSFPQADWQAGLATPLIRLRIVIYAQDCPRGVF